MGAEIDTVYIRHWTQLQEEAQSTPLYDIKPTPFWNSGTARLTFDSARGFDLFRRQCDAVGAVAPSLLDQQLTTLFVWVDEIEEFDAPFSRKLPRYVSGSWEQIAEGLLGAFNPWSIINLCEVADAFSWNECLLYFEKVKEEPLLPFESFRAYGQSWMDHYKEAQNLDAGLLIYQWG